MYGKNHHNIVISLQLKEKKRSPKVGQLWHWLIHPPSYLNEAGMLAQCEEGFERASLVNYPGSHTGP